MRVSCFPIQRTKTDESEEETFLISSASRLAQCGAGRGAAERFKQQHKGVAVQLQVENTARCCAAVSRGEVDVAVVGGQIPANLEHLLQARRPSLKKHACHIWSSNPCPPSDGTRNLFFSVA